MLSGSIKSMMIFGISLAILVGGTTFLQAQNPVSTRDSKTLELESVQKRLENTALRQQQLRREIDLLKQDVGAINSALVKTAARGQVLEQQVSTIEGRLAVLLGDQAALRQSFASKQGLLSEILGALQRMGRNPPPALLVQPQDALASVRSSILLGAVVPQIRHESATLLAELKALREITASVETEKSRLADRLNALAEDESRLTLLMEEKNKLARDSQSNLREEQAKAQQLGREAVSLKELIGDLETQIASAAAAALSAKLADENRKKREIERLAKARQQLSSGNASPDNNSLSAIQADPNRIEPAIAFSKARGRLLFPTSGVELYGFNDNLKGLGRTSNVGFATRNNARVRSPADGWVLYAGPFRSFGNILILNLGEGYRMVLSGLSEVNVAVGRFVLAGEPLGRMGLTRFAASIPLELGSNKPILSVELRKDGKSIDPAPWWAKRERADNLISSKRGT